VPSLPLRTLLQNFAAAARRRAVQDLRAAL